MKNKYFTKSADEPIFLSNFNEQLSTSHVQNQEKCPRMVLDTNKCGILLYVLNRDGGLHGY